MRTGEGRGRQGLLQAMANQMEAVRALRHTTSASRFHGDLQQAAGMPVRDVSRAQKPAKKVSRSCMCACRTARPAQACCVCCARYVRCPT